MDEPELKIVEFVLLHEADVKAAAQAYVKRHASLNYNQEPGDATFTGEGYTMKVEIIRKGQP